MIAISNSSFALYNPKGLDVRNATDFTDKYQCNLTSIKECEHITNDELLELECDVLVPAAIANQITEKNASKLKCRILVEGANAPTSPKADDILYDRGIFVVPDILANAGGLTVSCFEWVQNVQELLWSEKEVSERLEQIIKKAFYEVLKISIGKKVHLRTAAYIIGVGRVAKAMELRGIYP